MRVNWASLQIIDKEESVASGEDSDDLFDQFADDFQISETRSRLSVFTTEAVDTTEKNEDYYDELGTTTKSYEYQDDFSKPERTPKVIRNEKDESLDISLSDVETKSETETPSEGLLKGEKSSETSREPNLCRCGVSAHLTSPRAQTQPHHRNYTECNVNILDKITVHTKTSIPLRIIFPTDVLYKM